MKASTVQPFSNFLNVLNESIYGSNNIDVNNTHSGHVSFWHIKSIDKKIATYIKRKEYISAHDREQLYKLFNVIKNQGSHCTNIKLTRLGNVLKNISQINSEPCIAWDAITRIKKNTTELNNNKSTLQQERDNRFQILCVKLSTFPKNKIPEHARKHFVDCITEKDSRQLVVKFQSFIELSGNKIAINNSQLCYSNMEIKRIQMNVSKLPASSLSLDHFKCEINEIRKLNLDLDRLEHSIKNNNNRIDTLTRKFLIPNNKQGLDMLKKMIANPVAINSTNKINATQSNTAKNASSLHNQLFALTIRNNAGLLTSSGN